MSWKAGQILSIRLTTPSPAVTGSFLATFLISVTASFKRWQARCEPLHPNALTRSRALNVQLYFAAIDSRYFGIRRRLWPHENGNDVRLQPYFAPQAGHAASIPCSPGFDNGSINEIVWYGTFGMIEPRAPWLS